MHVIDMVKCPMCTKAYIDSELDLVCEKCRPTMNADMAVADLEAAVCSLEGCEPKLLDRRVGMLTNLYGRLGEFLQEVLKT